MRSMRWLLVGVVLVLVSCGGGASKSSDTTEVVSSDTTEDDLEKLELDLASYVWNPTTSLETFRTLGISVITEWGQSEKFFNTASGGRFCDDVHTLADFAAGVDRIQPKILAATGYANFLEQSLLPGKLGVTVQFSILEKSTGGPSQMITNYDRFQASHQLPCKGNWPLYDHEEFLTCSIPQVPGYDKDCFNLLKTENNRRTIETSFAFKSDFTTLMGEGPIISAVSNSYDGTNKAVELERIVYLPSIDRSVLLTVTLFDESQSFEQNELLGPATDIAIAIWNDIEADLAFCITTSSCLNRLND